MRRYLFLFCIVFIAVFFSACGSGEEAPADTDPAKADAPQIVTTIFPTYDWVNNILGDNPAGAEVHMLLDSGVDLHSFQPTSEDMLKIANCDLFIYVGGESDEWVDKALQEAVNKDMVVINLLDALGDQAKEEEIKEGMEAEEDPDADIDAAEEGHDADADPDADAAEEDPDADTDAEEHDAEEVPEYDEHVWLSMKNAQTLCPVIEEAIASVDPDNAEVYEANLAAYLEEIQALDQEYTELVKAAPVKTLLFGDRFPFRYLTDDYGLDYYAAFVGCSAETEASFETILFLSNKLDELDLHSVCTIEGSDQKIAQTIIENSKKKDQQILTMNSMQSVTSEDVNAGASWLTIMQENLEVLKQALQ